MKVYLELVSDRSFSKKVMLNNQAFKDETTKVTRKRKIPFDFDIKFVKY